MAEVYNYNRSDNIPSETGCKDLSDIELQQSMAELEKKDLVSTPT